MELTKTKFKQTEIGLIPEDWDLKNVGDCFKICNNLRLPISQEIRNSMQGIYPYYGPTKIQDYINEYRVDGEYALIGEDGDHFLKWYTHSMTQLASGKFNVNNHAHLIKGNDKETTTAWFYYFFKNRDITQFLTRQGAGRYKLSKVGLSNLPCAYPKIEEQKAIAQVLSDTDNLIQTIEQKLTKKRDIKQGAMKKLLTPKEDWEVKTLRDLIEILADYTANGSFESLKNNVQYYSDKNYAVLVRTTDLDKKKFEPARFTDKQGYDFLSKTSLKGGELILANVGSIGKVFRVPYYNMPMTLAPNTYMIKFFKNYSQDFIYQWMLTNEFKSKLLSKVGSTTLLAINKDNLRDIEINVPKSLSEQSRIATILSDMDAEIEQLEQKLSKYKLLKQGLMQNLLTGKIRLI